MTTTKLPKGFLSKLRKIRRLAEHPNTPAAEAETAMLHLRNLLLKHNLTEASVTLDDDAPAYAEVEACSYARLHPWQMALGSTLGIFTGTVALNSTVSVPRPRRSIVFYGSPPNAEFARYLFITLSRAYTAASRDYWRDYQHYPLHQRNASEWLHRRSFMHGCVYGLDAKIRNMTRSNEAFTSDKALMKVELTAVQAHLQRTVNLAPPRSYNFHRYDDYAFHLGYVEGRNSNLSRPVETDAAAPPAITESH